MAVWNSIEMGNQEVPALPNFLGNGDTTGFIDGEQRTGKRHATPEDQPETDQRDACYWRHLIDGTDFHDTSDLFFRSVSSDIMIQFFAEFILERSDRETPLFTGSSMTFQDGG